MLLYLRLLYVYSCDIVIMQSFPVDLMWYFGSSVRCTTASLVTSYIQPRMGCHVVSCGLCGTIKTKWKFWCLI